MEPLRNFTNRTCCESLVFKDEEKVPARNLRTVISVACSVVQLFFSRVPLTSTHPSVQHVTSTQGPLLFPTRLNAGKPKRNDIFMCYWRICVQVIDFRSWKGVVLVWKWRVELTSPFVFPDQNSSKNLSENLSQKKKMKSLKYVLN